MYIKNIHDSVSDNDLRGHFSSCGNITSVRIMRGERGESRGFGFVCFSNAEEAKKAVSSLHGIFQSLVKKIIPLVVLSCY